MKHIFHKKRNNTVPNRRQEAAVQRQSAASQSGSSFRRNRTLTGSSSPTITSSNEMNADLMSPRAHVHHLTKRRRHIFVRFIGVAVMALALYLFLNQFVATVSVTAGSAVDLPQTKQAAYQERIDKYYTSHVGERFHPALNIRDLTAYVQAKHPEVATVQTDMTGEFGKALARVTLRKPVARWVIDGRTEYVDSTGAVFGYSVYPTPRLTIVDKNRVVSADGLVASHRFLAFVGQTVGEARRHKLVVTKATIPLLTTRQLEVKFKRIPYTFKLAVDRSAGEQIEDASRIIRYFKKQHLTPGYVDVRVKGKAFYK